MAMLATRSKRARKEATPPPASPLFPSCGECDRCGIAMTEEEGPRKCEATEHPSHLSESLYCGNCWRTCPGCHDRICERCFFATEQPMCLDCLRPLMQEYKEWKKALIGNAKKLGDAKTAADHGKRKDE
jgi:hypothetical protein